MVRRPFVNLNLLFHSSAERGFTLVKLRFFLSMVTTECKWSIKLSLMSAEKDFLGVWQF